jgi:hypothetical protein
VVAMLRMGRAGVGPRATDLVAAVATMALLTGLAALITRV